MTPLEWIGIVQLVVVPFFGWVWKTWGDNVKDTRVRSGIDTFVRAAEEIASRGDLPEHKNKEGLVHDLMIKYYSKELDSLGLDTNAVELLIAAACQSAGIGASSKPLNKPS